MRRCCFLLLLITAFYISTDQTFSIPSCNNNSSRSRSSRTVSLFYVVFHSLPPGTTVLLKGTTLNSMDFADLSKYDDLCSDIFLDDLFLWFKTTKMNASHRKPRIHARQILDIIQRRVVEERKPNLAVKEVLE